MRYASFMVDGSVSTWGIEHEGKLYNLGPSGLDLAPSLKASLENGAFGNTAIDFHQAPSNSLEEVDFLPVIPDPGKIICIGVNYKAHQQETGKDAPSSPTIFTRFADSQMGHRSPALRPASTTQFDYEGEMAIVIGKRAFRVKEEDAWNYVAGYAAYNDFSARDWQRHTSQWVPGKNFPGTGAFGPYLVPSSDVGDVTTLRLETRVNGETRQSASLADLVFTIPQLIAYVTTFTPLSVGDVLVTGTPGGVGLFMEPQGLLVEGDVVQVEITGLGVLENHVVQE